MKYVVTGGSGFLGSHLVDKFASYGLEVVVIDHITNRGKPSWANSSESIKYCYMDLTNSKLVSKAISKGDVVIHLAAQSHVDVAFSDPSDTVIRNIASTQNLLQASVEADAAKVIIMSTDEVYGSTIEVEDYRQLNPCNPYSASKAAADIITQTYRTMHPEHKIITVRSNNIIGPRQYVRNILPRFTIQALSGLHLTVHGDGSCQRRYLWVQDAVNALFTLATENPHHDLYHIGHEDAISNLQVAQSILRYLDLENDRIKFIDDRRINDAIYPADSSLISKEYGWAVTKNFAEILPLTVDWYKSKINDYKHLL